MQKPTSVAAYLSAQPAAWQPALHDIRERILTTGLDEGIKWAFPVFTLRGKNVAAIYLNQQYAGVWFFQGALLSDPDGLLHNAQEGKTQAMRQLRFHAPHEVDLDLIEDFLRRAIGNEELGLRVAVKKSKGPVAVVVPPELSAALEPEASLSTAFATLTARQQHDYCQYVAGAKRAATKQSRLKKILPLIRAGRPLADVWKK